MPAELLFAPYAPQTLEPKRSIGARWSVLLDQLDLASAVEGKRTVVKMHLGGGVGFSTLHPFLVRKLVEKVREAGASDVFVADAAGHVAAAAERGYTAETLGCRLVPVDGASQNFYYPKKIDPPFREYGEAQIAGEIHDAEALIDLSHVKGHGDCGFGGASKNLSMGCVTGATRRRLHALEGGLQWSEEDCDRCRKCLENCPNNAVRFGENGRFSVFYHHCKFCQHCVLICPNKALTLEGGKYKDFQRGMALTTSQVLKTFEPGRALFVNVLTDVTIFCDCWGMTTPALVPDIGVLAGRDIVAVEQASLDMIRTEDLLPGALPPGWEMGEAGHLFERLHRKDPYVVVEYLEGLGHGEREYALREIA